MNKDILSSGSAVKADTSGSIRALLPFLLFLSLFLGTGIYLTLQGVDFAFYQLSAPVAALPAIFLAIFLSKDKLNDSIEDFIKGVGNSNVIAMCLIYLLAGAFAAVAKATGGVDATVNLGLTVLPGNFLLPGFFLISAFIATSMGTSMGTIGAVAPIALGVGQSAGIPLPVMAGAVLSGAMFGDNLSIISDTTIAATRIQGCEMKDKFRQNIFIALPAAIVAVIVFYYFSGPVEVPAAREIDWVKVIPYLLILILAASGLNVFAVLSFGLVLTASIGLITMENYSIIQVSKDIYKGFSAMQEIFLLSLMIGGLSALMDKQGGLAFLSSLVSKIINFFTSKRQEQENTKTAELGIAGVVMLTNICTANNTVAIMVAGGVAKDLAKKGGVLPSRAAGLLDIFSCVIQGFLPYGAQALLLGATFGISPLEVVTHGYYLMLLPVSALVSIFAQKKKNRV